MTTSSGFLAWFAARELTTSLVVAVLCAVHITRTLTGWFPLSAYALRGDLNSLFSYRLFTGAMLHVDGLHLALNSLALATSLGPKLEPQFGSLAFLYLLFLCTLLASAGYVLLVRLLAADTPQQTVGFSGCLFALLVIEAEIGATGPATTSLPFVAWQVPRRWMPWCLLVVIQLLIPNASFLGHLSGAVVGLVLARSGGCGGRWLFPGGGGGEGGGGLVDSYLASNFPSKHRARPSESPFAAVVAVTEGGDTPPADTFGAGRRLGSV